MMQPVTHPSTVQSNPSAGAFAERLSAEDFLGHLQPYLRDRFTGCLTFKFSNGSAWSVYLHLGRVLWIDGGLHPQRQWQRHLRQQGIQIKPKALLGTRRDTKIPSLEYHLLVLMMLRQSASLDQLKNLMLGIARERLFDLHQQFSLTALQQSSDMAVTMQSQPSQRPSSTGMLPQEAMLPIAQLMQETQMQWKQWVTSGLTHCLAEVAPQIVDAQSLGQKVTPSAYKQLITLLNGQQTLRDIACRTQKSTLQVVRLLLPYIRAKAIALQPVPDATSVAHCTAASRPPQSTTPTQSASDAPLVACIEDNAVIQEQLKTLLQAAGYRFLAITDPIQAMPQLLKHQPDLVFLDLVMPVANGYEVCAQIRRIQGFANLPVVMLTGQDGLVDRVRAKMVGATGFLSKPIVKEKILAAAAQYVTKAVAA
ncbi:MAG: response regulator [Spirulina sp. SIO3F2]|nr:response regulator [Spirulina sp. SIO3F2]